MSRSTLAVLIVFVLLLGAVLIFRGGPVERGTDRLATTDVERDRIDRLELEGPPPTPPEPTGEEGEEAPPAPEPERIELVRTDAAGWTVGEDGHLADPERIDQALETLLGIETTDVVSISETRWAEYGVDAASGITVTAHAGSKRPVRLVIGSPARGGTYIRRVGEDTVFHAATGLRPRFPLQQSRWLKLTLVDAELEDVERVTVDLADTDPYVLVPAEEDDGWQLADPSSLPETGFRFDERAARTLVSSLVNLRAAEIIEPPEDPSELGLEGNPDRLIVTSGDTTTTVRLGATSDDDQVYAAVEGRDAVLLLRSYQARNLRKTVPDLRDMRLLAYDPEQVTGLSITHDGQTLRVVRSDDGAWTIDPDGAQPPEEGFELDPQAVERLVSSMKGSVKGASLTELSPTDAATGLDRPDPAVTLELADGATIELRFGDSTTNDEDRTVYYATGNADERVYTVAEPQRNRFTRGWDLFAYVPPPTGMGNNPFANLTPEQIKNLPPELRQQIEQQMREQQRQQQMIQQLQSQSGG
jgi:hypothetical protein